MVQKNKIALIGGGNIGGTLAHILCNRQMGEVVILDRSKSLAVGKALDISQSTFPSKVSGTNDYKDIADANIVIITAGLSRKPGMTRDDLTEANAKVIKEVAEGVAEHAPDAFVIMITNPLDAMTYAFQKYSQFPSNMVVGMAGILDTSRFCTFIAQALSVSAENISAMVLGGHGDSMVLPIEYTSVSGIPLQSFIDNGIIAKETLDQIIERTRNGGAEIVSLLQTGSAYYAPAASAVSMAKAYLCDEKKLIPCSAYLDGEYGMHDIYMGVPCIIGGNGLEKIIEAPLNTTDKEMFQHSANNVRSMIDRVNELS